MQDPITVLIPCKDQKVEFFREAVASIVRQTCPDWRLLVVFDRDTPLRLHDELAAFGDPRIASLTRPESGFAQALNVGLSAAETDFVAILLSDDIFSESAIETLQRYRADHPGVDFFHSARRSMSAGGELLGPVSPTVADVTEKHFRTVGSPVKHLLCWRRRKALDIGGMDPELSPHGCDDYDFPWRMFKAGCRFQAIPDCLYIYRRHTEFTRLTTGVPVNSQIEVLHRMFRKHGLSDPEIVRFVQKAADVYLIESHDVTVAGEEIHKVCYCEAGPEMETEFLAKGFRKRHIFPHRVYRLPKGGPDGLRLARSMTGIDDPSRQRELVLCALPPAAGEFPEALFEDDDLLWHRQQFGLPAHVASANLVLDGDRIFATVYVSDVVQRISRRREFKTRIEKVFQGWTRMLLNALLDYAADLGVSEILSATAALAMRHTDRNRAIGPGMYRRIYDEALRSWLDPEAAGDWWRIDVARHADRRVPLRKRTERVHPVKTICILHDVERGFGHTHEDPAFAAAIEGPAAKALGSMLDIESAAGVRATYDIVGCLWADVQPPAAARGHACAFHSFDHSLQPDEPWQLLQCRRLDYRAKGYRPPKSRITAGLTDQLLSHHNFEWLASGRDSLGADAPRMENGIVKIPIHLDDYGLHRGVLDFAQWEARVAGLIERLDLVVIGLHDCYFERWLPHYRAFLERMDARARFRTLDQVAADVTLRHSRWL